MKETQIKLQERILYFGAKATESTIVCLLAEQLDSEIVLVKLTDNDGIYYDQQVENAIGLSRVSRIIIPFSQWYLLLSYARKSEVEVIVFADELFCTSDLINNGVDMLLRFLSKRYQSYGGCKECGLNILLLTNNSDAIEMVTSRLLDLAHENGLSTSFMNWMERCNEFHTI